jgi:hypothetical protein
VDGVNVVYGHPGNYFSRPHVPTLSPSAM